MNSDEATQLKSEIEFALSKALPSLNQVAQHYQVLGALKTKIGISSMGCGWTCYPCRQSCTSVPPAPAKFPEHSVHFLPVSLSFVTISEDSEIAQQFFTDIATKLSEQVVYSSQSIQQTDENFEIHFSIDLTKVNSESPMVCQWISDDILKCSSS